jgi:hypothetical protein
MDPASTDRPAPTLWGLVRHWMLPIALVAVGGALALLWGLSWGWSDFPDCAGGSSFLADLGWLFQGMALGLVAGIVVPAVMVARRTWTMAVLTLIATGVVMSTVGDLAAAQGAISVGCDPWYVRDAGQALLMGMSVGAVPTLLIGAIVALRRRPTNGPGPAAGWGETDR